VSESVSPSDWYFCNCVDCGKKLKARGTPPEKPICLQCAIIRAAPEESRERIRATLRPIPEDDATPVPPSDPEPEAPAQLVLGG
jgi:hypothetical protein